MKKTIFASVVTTLVAVTAGSTFAADATNWPTRPVQVVVPANAGGDTDFNARTMAKYFTQLTGKAMVITNMAGGGGTIAVSQVQGANPDGNTIFFGHTGQLVVNEVSGLTEDSFDVLDIACIAAVDKGAVFVSSKASGIKDVKGLVDKAKAAPGTVVYGTEMGGFSHLQGLMFEKLAGVTAPELVPPTPPTRRSPRAQRESPTPADTVRREPWPALCERSTPCRAARTKATAAASRSGSRTSTRTRCHR